MLPQFVVFGTRLQGRMGKCKQPDVDINYMAKSMYLNVSSICDWWICHYIHIHSALKSCGTCYYRLIAPLAKTAFCNWYLGLRPCSQSVFLFIPKLLDGVSQVYPHQTWFVHRTLSCSYRKGPFPNCCYKVGSTILSKILLYVAIALKFPFT